MDRRHFLRTTSLTAGLACLSGPELIAALLNPGKAYHMAEIRDGVGYFTAKGGTIGYYATDEALVVIDTQFPESVQHLIERLREESERRFDLLINTHHHRDHTAGNIVFKDMVDQVVAHENSKINQTKAAIKNAAEAEQLYPDTTFDKKWSTKLGGEKISLKYMGRAHTNGDIFVHFEEANVVHVGDLVNNRRYPWIDRAAGASMQGWIQVLDQAVDYYDKDTTFIFGHARAPYKETGNADDLKAMSNYLSRVLDHVKTMIRMGKSEEQVYATKMIPGADEWQGDGILRSLKAAYAELGEE